jgi:hypothetical protein
VSFHLPEQNASDRRWWGDREFCGLWSLMACPM